MSAADGWSRRALLASGAVAVGGLAVGAGATTIRLPQVRAPSGEYIGSLINDPVSPLTVRAHRFAGIRYARAARFQPPVPVTSSAPMAEQVPGFGPACPQPGKTYEPQSEDCLFLNVWVPAQAAKGLPVMVYFHGGAYATGSVTDPLNDGAALAARGEVVVVTVSIGGGWLSSRLMQSGRSANFARKVTMLASGCCVLPLLLVTSLDNMWAAVALIGLALAGHQSFSCNLLSLPPDMFPKRAVGSVIGLGGFAGGVGGMIMAASVGAILDVTGGNYTLIFAACTVVYFIAVLVIHLLAPRLARVEAV
jgi:Carboxylesterase family